MLQLETIDQARKRLQTLDEEILRKHIGDLVSKSQEEANLVLQGALKSKTFESLPDVTRGLASEQLRLLAHNISVLKVSVESKKHWWSVEQKFRTSITDALNKSIKTRPLNKEWFLLVLIATVSLPLFRQRELPVALSVLTLIAVSTYVIHWLGFLLYSRFHKTAWSITLLVTTLTIAIPLSFFSFVPGNSPTNRNEFAYSLTVILVTCFGHLAQAGLLQQKELLELESSALQRAQTENAQINFELARITKNWAQHIHGNIQSRLHAFALVLEQAQMLFVVGRPDQGSVFSQAQGRGLELLQALDAAHRNGALGAFAGQIEEQHRYLEVDQMGGDLRAHHAGAQHRDLSDMESIHGRSLLHCTRCQS
jgi:hypothetical protein